MTGKRRGSGKKAKKKSIRLTPMQRVAKDQVDKLLEGSKDVTFPLPATSDTTDKMPLSVQELLAGSQEVDVLPDGRLVPKGRGRTKEGKGVELDAHTFYIDGSLKDLNQVLTPRVVKVLPTGELILTAQGRGLTLLPHTFPKSC